MFLFGDQDDITVLDDLQDCRGKLLVIVNPNTIGCSLHLVMVATNEVNHLLTAWS
jgi:hypothetical protein